MNSDVAYPFKELLMGHSVKLDNVYYDKDNEESQQKILLIIFCLHCFKMGTPCL
jgi:hypothetical protein